MLYFHTIRYFVIFLLLANIERYADDMVKGSIPYIKNIDIEPLQYRGESTFIFVFIPPGFLASPCPGER